MHMKRALHRDYLRELVQDCIGCAACQNVCARDAIQLVDDTDGFLKPLIDEESCVGCRACERVCPIGKQKSAPCRSVEKTPQPSFYFGWHRDERLRYQSSSGGFFTALAQYVLERGGCVFGVVEEGCRHPRFAMAESLEELAPMRGSKYVQARADGVYRDVRAQLKTGRLVLFSGTPCQVGALYQLLRSRPHNLLSMDIVCHGVPSFHLFRRYLEHIRRAEHVDAEPESVFFRDKRRGWLHYRFGMRLKWTNDHEYYGENGKDVFLRGFLGDDILNRGCYSCRYVGFENRWADFTAADAWEAWRYYEEEPLRAGVSAVVLHTERAHSVMPQLACFHSFEVPESQVLRHNPALIANRPFPAHHRYALRVIRSHSLAVYLRRMSALKRWYRLMGRLRRLPLRLLRRVIAWR